MKKQKREYPDQFKVQGINLLRTTDRSASDIERELGITQGLLPRWNRKKAAPASSRYARRGSTTAGKRPLHQQHSAAAHAQNTATGRSIAGALPTRPVHR